MTLIHALHPHGACARSRGRPSAAQAFVLDGPAPEGTVARVRAAHSTGDYDVPFLCRRSDGRWLNDRTSAPIEVDVVGWRDVGKSSARRQVAG